MKLGALATPHRNSFLLKPRWKRRQDQLPNRMGAAVYGRGKASTNSMRRRWRGTMGLDRRPEPTRRAQSRHGRRGMLQLQLASLAQAAIPLQLIARQPVPCQPPYCSRGDAAGTGNAAPAALPSSRNTLTVSASRPDCIFSDSAAAAVSSTRAAFCCVTWSI